MKKIIKNMPAINNYYFLTVGILSLLFSITHAWNGQAAVLPIIDASSIDLVSKTTIFYVWHIISAENFIFGIAFLAMAFYKDSAKVKFAAWMIAGIMLARSVVILGSELLKNIDALTGTLTDMIAIVIFVGLIILGIHKGKRNRDAH